MSSFSENKVVKLPLYESIKDYNEKVYDIIQSYFNNHHTERLVRHQLESYNDFVQIQIEKTIQMFNPMHIRSENDYVAEKGQYFLELIVHFDNFKMHPPVINENNGSVKKLLPQEAKIRNITYASNMSLDMNVQYIIRNTENMDEPKIITKKIPYVSIGKMPVMVKSAICYLNTHSFPSSLQNTGECNMDCGGYFIIKGSEKTVLGQERTAENKIYCFDGKNTAKWSWMAEYKSIPDYKCISPKQVEMMIHNKNNGIYVQIPRIKIPIELFTLFRAYGIMTDRAICEYIVFDVEAEKNQQMLEFLLASITDGTKYMIHESALQHIISNVAYTPLNMDRETGQRKKREFTQDVLKNDVFPHCSTIPQKLFLIGLMASKLIKTRFGWIPQDDRDSYLNKRIELTGTLLNNLFRNYYNKLLKEMQKLIVREINTSSWRSSHDYENILHLNNIYKMIKPATIENGINRALATGDFSIKQMNSSKVGVAQVLNRLTYPATLSHMRRINTPLDKSGELIPPRRLHTTTWGFLCLTGDTDVLASNRIDMWKIKDMRDGQHVTTINRVNLNEEPSNIFRHFGKMADHLFEITTISGRKIKATAEHPFLVRNASGKYEMKQVRNLKMTDLVVIRHMVHPIPNENKTIVMLHNEDLVVESPYYAELSNSNWLNNPVSTERLKVIARLMGALMAEGHLYFNTDKELTASFYVNSEMDAKQLMADIESLGFRLGEGSIYSKSLKSEKWRVEKRGIFAHLLKNTFGFKKNVIPEWLINAELSIKREFLSGFQGANGCRITFYVLKPYLGVSYCLTEGLAIQIVQMFQNLGIKSSIKQREFKTKMCVCIDNSIDNLAKYVDTIYYAYCEEKRVKSAFAIEDIKIKKAKLSSNPRNAVGMVDNGAVCVYISSVIKIKPEMVYDFTTQSDNHSFIASSFVSSNCPIETPEGQSVGVVKNISYLTHITIPSNSSALYEFVKPFITPLEKFDTLLYGEDALSKNHILDKTKVVVNGCWLGITDDPLSLYNDLKAKKNAGILNIYTSVVFHYVLNEIQLCCDGGRLVRPLLRVDKDNKLFLNDDILKKIGDKTLEWNQLFINCPEVGGEAVMEYIDPDEQAFAMIAMKTKKGDMVNVKSHRYTHAEIHPSTIMGILASCIPFPDHNQAPRNTYQCLDVKETVWMADGRKKPIGEVIVGDMVLTFHPENLEITKTRVVGQFVCPNQHPVYKVTTIHGNEIIATEDHRFMTQYGWRTVENMLEDDSIKIGIIYEETTMFVFIQSITKEPDGLVSCIETESDNHSFIAGSGFMSSNCAMQKQAMGIYATNYDKRMDKTGYILTYPMRPLVDTRLMNFIHINRVPSGCQIYVAIMTHTGYNQEDSVLINQGAVDRGLFVTTIFHTEKDEDKSVIRDEIIRCKPDKTKTRGMKFGNYEKLNNKGFIPENTLVENRDILIAKITPIKENRNDPSKIIKYEDQSRVFRTTEETYIDRNITGRNGDGYNFAKTRTRIFRKPVIGDKFACCLPTQQLLTDAGWIDFYSLDITKHRVATLSSKGEILYEYPKEKFIYDYEGPLIEMQSQVHMICTPNHNLYIRPKTTTLETNGIPCWEEEYELKKAEDVEKELNESKWKGAEFQQVLSNGFFDLTFVPGTNDSVYMDEWLPLLGLYFNTTQSGINRERKYKNLYMALKLKQDVFPKYVWRMSQRQCGILMEALLKNTTEVTTVYTTPCQSLANDVMRLAIHAGGTGRVQLQQTGFVVNITLSKPAVSAFVTKGDIRHIYYSGKVYCVDMPTSHLYYFRETPYSPAFLSGNSRSSQKGTLGNLIPEQDMPFTKNGMRPDLILNPHAIPSRMTIAQLKETLLGKVLVELGMFGDGTAFNEDLTVTNISAELQKLGFESYGNEIMYDGTTGKQMEMSVFMGPVFYQRLKHMVNDKQHSRSIGPMVNLTRQPAEGRCRDGGFRIGEMERDVMIAHGMPEFCKDRLMDASDKYTMHVCKTCGMVASYNDGKMKKPDCLEGMIMHLCNTCQNRTEFARIEVPYTYKLLSQELQTINIVPRYITA